MKTTSRLLLSSLILISVASNLSAQLNLQWAYSPTDTNVTAGNVFVNDIARDSSGNIYVIGTFDGAMEMDPASGISSVVAMSGRDVFFAKYNASGALVWAHALNGVGNDEGTSIDVDTAGNVVIAGSFFSTMDFDPGSGITTLTSAGSDDIFMAKYDNSGNFLFAYAIGGTSTDEEPQVEVDINGNIYLTGHFISTNVDFDPGAGTQLLSSSGAYDVFVAKYDASGNYQFANRIGNTSVDQVYSIELDASANIYITGRFDGTVDFDPGVGTSNLSGSIDGFLAKYDNNGNYLMAFDIGAAANDATYDVYIDGTGNIFLAGTFGGTVDFDPGAGTANLTSVNALDGFLAKYDAAGNYLMAFQLGERGRSVNTNSAGDIFVSGDYAGTYDFDPGGGTANLTSNSASTDIFLAGYTSAGSYVFAHSFGGVWTGGDISAGIVNDASGNVIHAGNILEIVDFDPGVGTRNLGLASSRSGFLSSYSSSGTYQWAYGYGGNSTLTPGDNGYGMVPDTAGNVFIAGTFRATTLDLDMTAGTNYVDNNGTDNVLFAKLDVNGNVLVSHVLGSSATTRVEAMGMDGSGSVYIIGYTTANFDVNPGAGIWNVISSGFPTLYVAKFDNNGNFVNAFRIRGTGDSVIPESMFVTSSGDVYLSGRFNNTVDFDPGAGTNNLSAVGSFDIFFAKFDSSFNHVFAKSIGGTGFDYRSRITADASGNVGLAGLFSGTVDFDPNAGVQNRTSTTSSDFFVAKYTTIGNYVYAGNLPSNASLLTGGVVFDAAGNLFFAGGTNGTTDFDPGAGVQNLVSAGQFDGFISSYDVSGTFLNLYTYSSSSNVIFSDIYIDGSGNVSVVGEFYSAFDADPGAGTTMLTPQGTVDIAVIRYNSSMSLLSAVSMGAPTSGGGAYSIEGDASSNLYIAAYYTGAIDSDPGAGTTYLQTNAPSSDMLFMKLGPATPLPVELVEFKGSCESGYVNLEWTTASEINNSHFILEKSTNMEDWHLLRVLQGAGNSNTTIQYSYEGEASSYGTAYYRLTQVDFDGASKIYSPLSVKCTQSNQNILSVYPNPSHGVIQVDVETEYQGGVDVKVMDAFGRVVDAFSENVSNGLNRFYKDYSKLSSGTYYLKVETEGVVFPVQKLVIQ